jgi:flagellar assembly protein FliH
MGMRNVSRLEFHSLDKRESALPVEQPGEAQVPEACLEVEITKLDGRLRSQAAEMAARVEMARNEARTEARRGYEQELEERIADERASLLKAHEAFRDERGRYFAGVEAEVVKLALGIAARVLHREVKLDPLLLAGVVRVALEKVAKGSTTVLRVPPGELEMWRRVFAKDTASSLQLTEDAGLSVGECVLDTNVGTVELGVSAQLNEIERGFFDLLQQRPA